MVLLRNASPIFCVHRRSIGSRSSCRRIAPASVSSVDSGLCNLRALGCNFLSSFFQIAAGFDISGAYTREKSKLERLPISVNRSQLLLQFLPFAQARRRFANCFA